MDMSPCSDNYQLWEQSLPHKRENRGIYENNFHSYALYQTGSAL